MSETERFWSFVKIGPGCWEWQGATYQSGYGAFSGTRRQGRHGRSFRAHRYAFQLANGGKEPEGLVCHHCDNPKCVRPDHLFVGSAADNAHDRDHKGRSARGANNGNARLDSATVSEIRRLKADGASERQLARQFGVSNRTIGRVVRRECWRHVL